MQLNNTDVANGTPAETFIKDADYCFEYDTETRYLGDQFSWTLRKQLGFEFQVESGEEYAKTDPLYADKFHTVVRCKQHGMVIDPGAYVKALAQHFQDSGGELVLADVIGMGKDNTGKPFLDSPSGKMSADKLVLTAGVWSRPFMEKMGIKVPMESERGYHLELNHLEISGKSDDGGLRKVCSHPDEWPYPLCRCGRVWRHEGWP